MANDSTGRRPPTPTPPPRGFPSSTEKRRSLQFPMIPPLPSSLNLDKENQRQTSMARPDSNSHSNTAAAAGSHSLHRSASTPIKEGALSASSPFSSSYSQSHSRSPHRSPSPSVFPLASLTSSTPGAITSSSSRLARRVLRCGETMESLFALDKECTDEHWKLARSLVDGSAADDANAWLRILHLLADKAQERHNIACKGNDLIRLHRRATARFALDTSSSKRRPDVFALYLSYAKAQALHASEKDARMTLRHVQNQRGSERVAALYLTLAEVEEHFGNRQAAREALQLGIEKNAEPLDILRDALSTLESKPLQSKPAANANDANNKAQALVKRQAAPSSATTSATTTTATSKSPNKRKLEQHSSPKRRKTEAGAINVKAEIANLGPIMEADETLPDTDLTNDTKHSIRFQLAPQQRPQEYEGDLVQIPVFAPKERSVMGSSNEKTSAKVAADRETGRGRTELTTKKAPGPSSTVRKPTTIVPRAHGEGSNRAKRPPLLSKTPRLSSVGLMGKARRADPDQSMDIQSETDSEPESTRRPAAKEKSIAEPHSALKVKKVDLGYMFAWDPTAARGSATKEFPTNSVVKAKLDKIDEAPPSVSSNSTASVVTAGASTASHSLSNHSNDRKSLPTSDCLDAGTPIQPAHGTPQRKDIATESTAETAALIAKSNRDFLPLVSEKNMLRVNGVPYAKLGVVGKGGSCKVYRALSKDCSVVGIKKVKLDGMDKKAIEGYANEIALLKRLRGNPAIIQMYDSEVDLERKAIFVTMELGEVDLNHVLQQQALLHDGSGGRNLNMNFIRLTWQQMLSAVHCIHEERIIHSDLKPANFLFVRGALKLIDFGIAKAIQSDDTMHIYRESQIGTLNYMSPEAILDTGSGQNVARMKIGRASDIWSLGCILYQMVYGKTPFAELHMIQKLQAIVNPNHVILFPDCVDGGAVDAIKLCLRRNPADRPPIVGSGGLLNEHFFLNSHHASRTTHT